MHFIPLGVSVSWFKPVKTVGENVFCHPLRTLIAIELCDVMTAKMLPHWKHLTASWGVQVGKCARKIDAVARFFFQAMSQSLLIRRQERMRTQEFLASLNDTHMAGSSQDNDKVRNILYPILALYSWVLPKQYCLQL